MSNVATSAGDTLLTRLRAAQAELASLRRELDHTHQLATLGILTAGIAHEINNILTPVLAYAQLASANPGDKALHDKALERAIAGVEAASRIAEGVLGFARIDDENEQANVAEVIEASMACLGRNPARDAVRVVIDADPAVHVGIRPLALQQVLLNLILNALNALRGKPGELRITAHDGSDGMTRIRVSDTGPGIPRDLADRLFEPFVSTHVNGRPGPTGRGGTGLGLAVCRRLVENGGGTIVLDAEGIRGASTDTGGASFTILLPSSRRR